MQGQVYTEKEAKAFFDSIRPRGSISTTEAFAATAWSEDKGDLPGTPPSPELAPVPVSNIESPPSTIDADRITANVARNPADLGVQSEPRLSGEVDDIEQTGTIAGNTCSAGPQSSDSGGRNDRGSRGPAPGGEAEHLAEIIVDEEFSKLIPPLSREEFALLEQHLLTEGCREPILVWNDRQRQVLLDGHNRLQICQRHQVQYIVRTVDLQGRDAARLWMLEHQLGRRNLTPEAQAYLRGNLYEARRRQGARTRSAAGHFDQKLTTSEQLAAEQHVGEKTIRRDTQFAEQLDQLAEEHGADLKRAVLARDAKMSRRDLARILQLDSLARAQIVAEIRTGKPAADLIRQASREPGNADGERPPRTSATFMRPGRDPAARAKELPSGTTSTAAAASPCLAPWSEADNDPDSDEGDRHPQDRESYALLVLGDALKAVTELKHGEVKADLLAALRGLTIKLQDALNAHQEVIDR